MKYALPLALAVLTMANAHAADIQAGKELFNTRCASCHHVGPSARAAFGPQLNGIFGRKAGSTSDYRYSDAMKASPIVWNDTTLRAFVGAPGKTVPGTKMRFWGMSDQRQVDDLLAYLRTFQ